MVFKIEGKGNTIFSNTQDFTQKIENLTYLCRRYHVGMSYLYRIQPIPIIYYVYYPVILENARFYILFFVFKAKIADLFGK